MLKAVTLGAVHTHTHTHTHTSRFIKHILEIEIKKNKDPCCIGLRLMYLRI